MALKGERGVTSKENLYSAVWALVKAGGGGEDGFWAAHWPEVATRNVT